MSITKRLDFRQMDDTDKREIKRVLEKWYLSEMSSTTQIARRVGKSPTYVWKLLNRLGIALRTPDEGKALAAPFRIRTIRRPFDGSAGDRFYLKGFSEGDLDVRKPSSNAVMVSSTTTHPAFVSCFRELFQSYGPMYEYPILDVKSGYRWKVASRLDNSFSFMLPSQRRDYPKIESDPALFFAWLAGIVDTDGSIIVVHSGIYLKLLLLVANQDLNLLSHIKSQLERGGFHPTGPYLQARGGQVTPGWGIKYTKDMWNLYLQRADDVRKAASLLPLRHQEKIMRKELALTIPSTARWSEFGTRVLTLRSSIKEQVNEYVAKAEREYKMRDRGVAT